MTVAKTGAEHIASLRDGRTVYIDGDLVEDVTTHPAFQNAVKSSAALYDYQAKPGKYRTDDLHAGRLQPPRQPRLADAEEL